MPPAHGLSATGERYKDKLNDPFPYYLFIFGLENSPCVDKVVIR